MFRLNKKDTRAMSIAVLTSFRPMFVSIPPQNLIKLIFSGGIIMKNRSDQLG